MTKRKDRCKNGPTPKRPKKHRTSAPNAYKFYGEYTVFTQYGDTLLASYATDTTLVGEYHKVYSKAIELMTGKKVSFSHNVIDVDTIKTALSNARSKGDDTASFEGGMYPMYVGPISVIKAIS